MPKRQREGVVIVEFGDDLKAQLESFALAQRATLADVIRHAVARHMAYPPEPAPLTPLPPAGPTPATATGGAAARRKKPAGRPAPAGGPDVTAPAAAKSARKPRKASQA